MALVAGCAAGQRELAPEASRIVGTVRLVPHEGVTPTSGAGAYRDRNLHDAELVDYSKPGFAVVAVAGLESPGGAARVALRSTRFASRFEPRYAALGVGGSVEIRNDGDEPRAISCPSAGVLTGVAPGARVSISAARVGELRCFALGAADDTAEPIETTLYVAPGPYAVVGSAGQFELDELRPDTWESGGFVASVQVWHPPFPPVERDVVLRPGATERLELELQVR